MWCTQLLLKLISYIRISFVAQMMTTNQSHFHLVHNQILANRALPSLNLSFLPYLSIIEGFVPFFMHTCLQSMTLLYLVEVTPLLKWLIEISLPCLLLIVNSHLSKFAWMKEWFTTSLVN